MRILLVRLDGIGDALACAPLVASLRDAGHELGVALTPRNAAIFARETFAWTHVLARRPWPAHGHAADDVARTIAEAREIGYQTALIASEEPDAYELGHSAAARRIGFINGWEKPLKTLQTWRLLDRAIVRPASLERVTEHEAFTLFRLGEGLTKETEPPRDPSRLQPLIVDGATFDRAARRTAEPYIALQLTPKWAALGVDAGRLARLARALRELAPVRLLVGSEETSEVQSVGDALATDTARVDATIFEGEEGMRAWKRAIADAAVLVTPDTGAAHVAGMTGTPCVDVFPDEPLARTQICRWSPWAAPSATLIAGEDATIVTAAQRLFERTCAPS